MFKILQLQIDGDFDKYFLVNNNNFNTRGHSWKLKVNRPRLDCRKLLFCNRVITAWNRLPAMVVNLRSFDRLKIAINNYS